MRYSHSTQYYPNGGNKEYYRQNTEDYTIILCKASSQIAEFVNKGFACKENQEHDNG
jgi:hypothetical protein